MHDEEVALYGKESAMLLATMVAAADSWDVLALLITAVSGGFVAVISYLSNRNTKGGGTKKGVQTSDYRLKKVEAAVPPAEWKSVTAADWARHKRLMKWVSRGLAIAAVILFIVAIFSLTGNPFAAGGPFTTGTPRPVPVDSAPTIPGGLVYSILLLAAIAAEFGWIVLSQALRATGDKTAEEAGTSSLQLVVEGEQHAVLSRCIAAMRKLGHAIASVDVMPAVATVVSVGGYGTERLEVIAEQEPDGEHRLKISAERKPSVISSGKTQKLALRMVEQLIGYRLYTAPPPTRKGDKTSGAATIAIEHGREAATTAQVTESSSDPS